MNIPEEYNELYLKITDNQIFIFQKWYKYPENEFQIEFIEWYYKSTLNIEFSETKSHFKVIDFSAPAIDKWKGKKSKVNCNHPLVLSRLPERIEKQRKYWENFWAEKKATKQAEISELDLM